MTRLITNLLTTCLLLTCADSANVARAQEVNGVAESATKVNKTNTPAQKSLAGPLQKTKSEQEASEVARELHQLLDAPIKDLAELARRLSAEVLAGLEFAAAITTAREQEALFKGARIDLLLAAEQKQGQRAELKLLLLEELRRIKDAYKETIEQRRREEKVIRIFRPRLRQLSDQEDKLRELAKETDQKLLNIRRRREELQANRRLAEKTLTRSPAGLLELPVIPQLELPSLDPRLRSRGGGATTGRTNLRKGAQPTSPSPTESYEELIDSLKSL